MWAQTQETVKITNMRLLFFLLLPFFSFAQSESFPAAVKDSLGAHQTRLASLESNPSAGFDPISKLVTYEEFMGYSGAASGTSASGALGELGWTEFGAVSGGFNQSLNISPTNNPGVMRLNITASNGSAAKLYLKGGIRIAGDFRIKCAVRCSSIPTTDSFWGLVGLQTDVAIAAMSGSVTALMMGFGATADSTCIAYANGAALTTREKGVPVTTGVTDFFNLEMFYDYSATTVYFYVEGVLVDSFSYTFTAADHYLTCVANKIGVSNAVDFYIDYVYFEYTTSR